MTSLEAGLAFFEGIALIASPCILPVLPLVLSGGIEGGKARPFGITAGFVVSFSAFVLASRQIVGALHVAPDVLRQVSLVLLFILGLVMLSEKLSQAFAVWTQGFANLGQRGGEAKGFWGGLGIGALIGFVWTPCAGPILAAVLVQVIRQQTDLQSAVITFAFALGAALPMLAITLVGKNIMNRFRFFARHAEAVRKLFAILILLAVGFMAFGADAANWFGRTAPAVDDSNLKLEDGLPAPYAAPEFTGLQSWLNSSPLTLQQLKGKVVLVDFWTYSCVNCVRTLPHLTAWDAKYRDQGLVIIGVHAPEFEFEKNTDNIQTAIGKYGIHYPVAVDNNLATWIAFKNQYWPAHYLIDREGRVVYRHFGEGNYALTENNIRYLLGLKNRADGNPSEAPLLRDETRETYLGYARATRFNALSELQKDVSFGYKPVNFVPEHHWSLGGAWTGGSEKITSAENSAYLRLNFKAKKVFLVMGAIDGKPHVVAVQLNGAPVADKAAGKDVSRGKVTVTGHALYELINQPLPENGLLDLTVDGAGVEMYAFTFGE